jgi:CHAT domain-containing protein
VAAGTAPPGEAQQLLAHAAHCVTCAKLLREALEDLGTDLQPEEEADIERLATSRPEWPHDFARRLVLEDSSHKRARLHSWLDWRVLAAVATAVAVAVFGWQWYGSSARQVENLLASAYRANRSIEFRLPGSPYAPQGVALRGPENELPPDLSDAYAIARRKAAVHPSSAEWLDLKGRSELLAGTPEKAIATLLAAEEQDSSNVEILNDLSVAYAVRSGSGSSREDLAAALRFNERALQKSPTDSVALFNRALMQARLGEINNAAASMSQFLKLHPDGPWAAEARRKLAEWESMLREHSALPDDSPEGYLRGHGDSEIYVESAVRQWLPRMNDAATRAALRQLSAELASQHEDVWLRDVLAQPTDDAAMQTLASAAEKNLKGDYSGAIVDAKQARRSFEHVGARAAQLRAQFELTYAERRLLSGQKCGPDANELVQRLQDTEYPYLQAQAWLEAADCEGFLGSFAQSVHDVDSAIAAAQGARLRIIGMRAVGFKASFEADQGDPVQMWSLSQAGLSEYWRSWAPAMRAYHFLTEMEFSAETDAEWSLAKSLQQEALYTLEADPDKDLKAMAHFRMARLAVATGDTATADREFQTAAELFRSAPDPRTARLHEMESRVGLAGIQLRRDATVAAQKNLDAVGPLLDQNDDAPYYLKVEYQGVRGDVARAQKQWTTAEDAYSKGVGIAEDALPTLPDAAARLNWSALTEHPYRELASILIARGDSDAAWRLWQKRCSAALAGNVPVASRRPGNGQIRLTYLVLDDRIAIWSSVPNRDQFRVVDVGRVALERESRRLIYLCSRPDADSAQLHSLARKLYQDLIAPVAAELASAPVVVVQPDAPMADIPFEVLEDASGVAVGEHHQLLYSPGLAYDRDASAARMSAGTALLLIGDSSSAASAQFGMEDEVESLRRVYPRSVVIPGGEASRELLVSSLPAVELLEFVGHGRESFTGAGLVVRQERPGRDGLVLDASLLESVQLPKTKLAVLSACSTARGQRGLLDPKSLVQSFLRAGAGSVVASRWDVDSASTARLMAAFHQNLARGRTVSEALWLASSDLRQQTGNQPFYWAAFSVYE